MMRTMGTATAVIFLVLPSNVVALAGLEKAVLGAPDWLPEASAHLQDPACADLSALLPRSLGCSSLSGGCTCHVHGRCPDAVVAFRALGRWVPRPLIVTRLLHA